MFLLMSKNCYCYLVWKPDTTVCVRKCYFFGTLGCQANVLIYVYMYAFPKVSLVSVVDEKNIDIFTGISVDD